MRLVPILTLGVLLPHCASQAVTPPPDPKAENQLAGQRKRRDALQERFKQAPAPSRQRCELSAGDCRMDVTEGRDKLLRDHSSAKCRAASDSDAEADCVSGELVSAGKADIANEYYRLQTWCWEQLASCTAKLADDAVAEAQRSARENRRERIEAARSGIVARAQVTFADERIAYLRALLPVAGDTACTEHSNMESCQDKASKLRAELDAELEKSDSSYDERQAASLYEASHAALAECRSPEAECLTKKLDNYGGTAETRRYLADTLKSLARRQELVVEAGAEAAEPCLDAGVQQYQTRIVEDYRRFAREPVLFFQAQLHRDFRGMYDAQVGCLKANLRPARKAGNSRNAARTTPGAPEPG